MPAAAGATAGRVSAAPRTAARLLVLDAAGRVLLLPARDPSDPSLGEWLEVPGGAAEPGERPADAARREVAEETGVLVLAGSVSSAVWVVTTTYRWLGCHRTVRELVHLARLPGAVRVVARRRDATEVAALGEPVWVPRKALPSLRTYPCGLAPALLALQAGHSRRTPRQHWS